MRGSFAPVLIGRYIGSGFIVLAVLLFAYGVAWNFSTRRYLKGFADAIVPLDGSPQEKSEAILSWLRLEPQRRDAPDDLDGLLRDPVGILQNAQLLKVCGSASNAFINLADSAGLKTRRLLLLGSSGVAKHVVAEVQWGKRWVVVDPSLGIVFKNGLGKALSAEELRDPVIFQDAIGRMPGYNSTYSFEHTTHVRLERVPLLGAALRRGLNRWFPRWENAFYWASVLENPSSWPMLASIPLFLAGLFTRWVVYRYHRDHLEFETMGIRKRLISTGRAFLYRSA